MHHMCSFDKFIFPTLLSLLNSPGTVLSLSTSKPPNLAFRITKSVVDTSVDVSIPAPHFRTVFVS